MQLKPLWRAVPRSASLLVLAVLALVWTKTFLWAPLLLLAIFFFAVDVLGIHKRMLSKGESMEETPSTYGVLGDYVVDEAPSHGLFIRLCERAVFVDIKQDRMVDLRKARAAFLYEHQAALDEQLCRFMRANPSFATRSIRYIGLHSEDIEQGEVFWDPDGYTLLKGLTFIGQRAMRSPLAD